MLYAINSDSAKILATPKAHGTCPGCRADLIAKCGSIITWHWSHKWIPDCDSWYESESNWHLAWKAIADPNNCEVVIENIAIPGELRYHRADIVSTTVVIIELQHSSLDPDTVTERETFYKKMIWLIDATPFIERISFRNKGNYHTFRWDHIRKWMLSINAPLYWDIGDEYPEQLFHVKKLNSNQSAGYHVAHNIHGRTFGYKVKGIPAGGWGYFVSKQEFINTHLITPSLPESIYQEE